MSSSFDIHIRIDTSSFVAWQESAVGWWAANSATILQVGEIFAGIVLFYYCVVILFTAASLVKDSVARRSRSAPTDRPPKPRP